MKGDDVPSTHVRVEGRLVRKADIPKGCFVVDGHIMTTQEVERHLSKKQVFDNVAGPFPIPYVPSRNPTPAPKDIDEGVFMPGKNWKPMTSEEAAKILAEEEPWPEDPDC
jgi:hypothetical protein